MEAPSPSGVRTRATAHSLPAGSQQLSEGFIAEGGWDAFLRTERDLPLTIQHQEH